jgi:hypothetical protein
MLVDIKKIPMVWITHPKSLAYKQSMQTLIKEVGFENTTELNGESINKDGLSFIDIQNQKTNAVAMAHIEALKMFEPPFLILEDDCALVSPENIKTQFDVPDCDALYLGSHNYGMVRNVSTRGGTISSFFDDEYIQVYNMLGIHAILYMTDEYVKSSIEYLEECIAENRYCDECIAINMKSHLVLSLQSPVFYQRDGHNDELTKTPVNPLF